MGKLALAAEIEPLNLTVANPPTPAQVQAIANKLDLVISALQGQ